MKANLFKTAFLLLLTACFACEKEYPVDISFQEYSLAGTSCQWINLDYDENLIIINSNDALKNYITCIDSGYPEIDFSKYTLLLVSGTTPNGIENIEKDLQQLSADAYKLDVKITLNDATVVEQWCVALITHKLSAESQVQLNVSTDGVGIEYPKDIPFTEYSLEGTSCQWVNLNYDESVIIINSGEELENYISCTEGNYPEIDFSKNTLLLASGSWGPNQSNIATFFQNSETAYTLEVMVLLNGLAAVIVEWDVAALVPKISNGTNVTLTVKHATL